jgi:hypothetical protein
MLLNLNGVVKKLPSTRASPRHVTHVALQWRYSKGGHMNSYRASLRKENADLAESMWPGDLGHAALEALDSLSEKYGFSVALGDLMLLDRKWYVTHAGLLRIAQQQAMPRHQNYPSKCCL